jgi:phosphatidate phosphatase
MAYSMVYLTIYIQKRLPMNNSSGVMLRSLIQGLALNLAIYVGYTRISDYWHHWSDVLMGLIQGSISSLITAYHLSDLFIDKTLSKPQLNSKNSNSSVDSKETEVQVRLIKQTSI